MRLVNAVLGVDRLTNFLFFYFFGHHPRFGEIE